MPKLIALTPINHDGKTLAEGDAFDVADEVQVAQLVESGAATVKGRKSKADATADAAAAAALAAAEADAQAILDAASQAAEAEAAAAANGQ
jgi:hypothetical protein